MEPIPYDKRKGKIWFNGLVVDWEKANLHVLSHGLHYGSCVFEGERVYNGKIFKLREHTDRLIYSAKRMGFEIPFSADEIDNACNEIIKIHESIGLIIITLGLIILDGRIINFIKNKFI